MGAGGQSATCKTCGMEYSVERVRELMALDTVAAAPQADRQEQATTPALQEDVLEATWEETSDADVAALPTEIFHMMVDEAHYILGQGALLYRVNPVCVRSARQTARTDEVRAVLRLRLQIAPKKGAVPTKGVKIVTNCNKPSLLLVNGV